MDLAFEDRQALISMARRQKELNDCDECSQYYQLAFEMDAQFTTLVEWAEMLNDFERHNQAQKLYHYALEWLNLNPEQIFIAYKNLGNICLRIQDLDAAEENYHKAYALNPESEALLINLGTLELQRGKYERALQHFRDCVLRNRKNEKAWLGLALSHRQYGDFELSWANLIEALELDIHNPTAWQMLIEWSYRDGKLSLASRWLTRALQIRSQDAALRLLFAQVLYDLGNLEAAAEQAVLAQNLNAKICGANELIQQIDRRLKNLRT